MLKESERQLNDLIVDIYDSVQRVEEKMLRNTKLELSITETNILDVVGRAKEEGCTISEISNALRFSLPTVTVAVTKLVSKGFVTKERSVTDKRVYKVVLTRKGRKADAVHRYFHEQAVRAILRDTSNADAEVILHAMQKFDSFLKQYM